MDLHFDLQDNPSWNYFKTTRWFQKWYEKTRLSAERNWIMRLQTPYTLWFNDQIYQQGNISSVRSNINVFSLKPDVRRKRRSHCVRRNGLSRRKQRLYRSLDYLLRIAKNRSTWAFTCTLVCSSISTETNPGWGRPQKFHSDWFKLQMIMAFSFNKLFPRIPQRPPKTQFIKIKFNNQGLDLLNISNIFRDHRVTSKIPQYFENLDRPLICYQYKKYTENMSLLLPIKQWITLSLVEKDTTWRFWKVN